jgi:hypothetical protein
MIYASVAFDELMNLSPEDVQRKGLAFAFHTERLLGAKENSLRDAIMKIIMRQSI